MLNWSRGGWTGSLRRWTDREVNDHISSNPTLRNARYSPSLRCLRAFMQRRPFAWFVGLYALIDLSFLLLDALSGFVPNFRPSWASSSAEIEKLIQDGNGYFIVAQVGALGIVSIAVGLVTLIAQRESATADIQIYYHESLAQEVVASSVALLAVLCAQVFWPAQLGLNRLGLGNSSIEFQAALTGLHGIWLFINLAALAHFVALSLSFVQPSEREAIRERYTANWVTPNDLARSLRRARYMSAAEGILRQRDNSRDPMIIFGRDLDGTGEIEVRSDASKGVALYDVWLVPLRWLIRRWWRRCIEERRRSRSRLPSQHSSPLGPQIWLVFPASFDRPSESRPIICRRRGGVPLTPFEQTVLRWSFWFRGVGS